MQNDQKCSQCGATFTTETPEGLCPACLLRRGFETQGKGSASEFHPPTPESLAGRFPQLEIVQLLGRGGMGVVYKARHRGLDRWVALKILLTPADRDPAFTERFSREARALAKLSHPNIVNVFDSGEVEGLFYFIMEYVDGPNLREVLAKGEMAPEQALAIVPQICDALQYAHDQGIVHRDIKPENILVDQSGRVKIADFGIAKILGMEAHDFTLTGKEEIMGTPAYMAPEQVEHPGKVDHRADIYSLGVVFYQMLTGELPLGRFARPSERKVRIDVRLDEVVLRTLEKEPGLRYQQAGEVKSEVETITGSAAPATGPVLAWGWMKPGMQGPINYRSKTTVFGIPLIHIAQGVDPATGRVLIARGIIAIGRIAQGVVAIGGWAMGVFAFGGLSCGVFSFGGLALGILSLGGAALGLLGAYGGLAVGLVSMGGAAVGYYSQGGWAGGIHPMGPMIKDPAAVQFFQMPWMKAILQIAPLASPAGWFLIVVIVTCAIWWAQTREKKCSPTGTPRWWVRLAVMVSTLVILGTNFVVVWAVTHQQRKKQPASHQTGVSQIVRQTVETISQCGEGDPRVTAGLSTLRTLNPSQVISNLVPYLDSSVPTLRRAAIYILYSGGLDHVEPAIEPLKKLLGHSEEFTRGMAAIALGTNRVTSSFDGIVSIAQHDSSPYARRCAVYALGLLGDQRAIPVLQAAQTDPDPSIARNANIALDMLERNKRVIR